MTRNQRNILEHYLTGIRLEMHHLGHSRYSYKQTQEALLLIRRKADTAIRELEKEEMQLQIEL